MWKGDCGVQALVRHPARLPSTVRVMLCSSDIWKKKWIIVYPTTALKMSTLPQLIFSLTIIHCNSSKGKLSWSWLNKLKNLLPDQLTNCIRVLQLICLIGVPISQQCQADLVPWRTQILCRNEENELWTQEWKSPFCSHLWNKNTGTSVHKSQLDHLTCQQVRGTENPPER